MKFQVPSSKFQVFCAFALLALAQVICFADGTPYIPATQAQVNAGTSGTTFVSPATLALWPGGGSGPTNGVTQAQLQNSLASRTNAYTGDGSGLTNLFFGQAVITRMGTNFALSTLPQVQQQYQPGDSIVLTGMFSTSAQLVLTNVWLDGSRAVIFNSFTNQNGGGGSPCFLVPVNSIVIGCTISNIVTGVFQAGIGSSSANGDPALGKFILNGNRIYGDSDGYFFGASGSVGVVENDPGTTTHWDFGAQFSGTQVEWKNDIFNLTPGSQTTGGNERGLAINNGGTALVEHCTFNLNYGGSNNCSCFANLNSTGIQYISDSVFYLTNGGGTGTNATAILGGGGTTHLDNVIIYGGNSTNGAEFGVETTGGKVIAVNPIIFPGQTNFQVAMNTGAGGQFQWNGGGNISQYRITGPQAGNPLKNLYAGGDFGSTNSGVPNGYFTNLTAALALFAATNTAGYTVVSNLQGWSSGVPMTNMFGFAVHYVDTFQIFAGNTNNAPLNSQAILTITPVLSGTSVPQYESAYAVGVITNGGYRTVQFDLGPNDYFTIAATTSGGSGDSITEHGTGTFRTTH